MKIILLEDIKKLGQKNDVIDVSDGYAKNFLIKNNKAVLATLTNLKSNNNVIQKHEKEIKEHEKEAELLKIKIESTPLKYKLLVHNGKASHTISIKKIIQDLSSEHGIKIDKHQILKHESINNTGKFTLKVKLSKNVNANLIIFVEEY